MGAVALAVITACAASWAASTEAVTQTGLYTTVIDEDFVYKTIKGDYPISVAGKCGVDIDKLWELNPDCKERIYPGNPFFIRRACIVPNETNDGIIINIPERMLYRFKDGALVERYPVALGKPTWKTPRGEFTIIAKAKDPTWHIPPSIQKEMAEKGETVRESVPPGKDNPLGRRAMRTSIEGVMIHATIWPDSLHKFRSHGCIRMNSDDIEKLFDEVQVGDNGKLVYIPVKIARTADGRIYMEAYRDAYRLAGNLLKVAESEIESAGLKELVDWDKVKEAVAKKDGTVVEITRK